MYPVERDAAILTQRMRQKARAVDGCTVSFHARNFLSIFSRLARPADRTWHLLSVYDTSRTGMAAVDGRIFMILIEASQAE